MIFLGFLASVFMVTLFLAGIGKLPGLKPTSAFDEVYRLADEGDKKFWSDVSESLRKSSATASRALPSGDRAAEAMRSAARTLGDGYWDRDGQWKRFDRQQTEILEETWELESKKLYQEFIDQQAANGAMSEDNEKDRLQKSMQDLSADRINKKLEEQRRKILENL